MSRCDFFFKVSDTKRKRRWHNSIKRERGASLSAGGMTVNRANRGDVQLLPRWRRQLAYREQADVFTPSAVLLPEQLTNRRSAVHPASADCELRCSSSAFCLSLSEQRSREGWREGEREREEGRQLWTLSHAPTHTRKECTRAGPPAAHSSPSRSLRLPRCRSGSFSFQLGSASFTTTAIITNYTWILFYRS